LEIVMFKLLKKQTARPLRKARRQAGKPTFESVEPRTMMSGTIWVNTTANPGTGLPASAVTLADAIKAVDTGKYNVIDFDIPKTDPGYSASTGLWTITPKTQLPQITQPVIINGTTRTGTTSRPVPLIEIDGKLLPNGQATPSIGIDLAGGNEAVHGLSVDNVDFGFYVEKAGGDTVSDDAINTRPDTVNGQEIGVDGAAIEVESSGNNIGGTLGNTISNDGPLSWGIRVFGKYSNNQINYNTIISTNGDIEGIDLDGATGTQVSGNTVNTNGGEGIEMLDGASGNSITGNHVTDSVEGILIDVTSSNNSVTGNTLDNCATGIFVDGANNTIGAQNQGNTISNIGGSDFGNEGGDGIYVRNSGNTVSFNKISTTAHDAIELSDIASAAGDGAADNCTVQGNTITLSYPGATGIELDDDGGYGAIDNNTIGAADNAADANVITVSDATTHGALSGNSGDGISIASNAYDNSILGNSITVQGAKGIDLHGGGDNALPAPVITSASTTGPITTIGGTVHSFANSSVRIEFFASAPGSSAEGQTYLGAETVSTNASGNASFVDSFAARLGGDVITATATTSRIVFNQVGRLRLPVVVGDSSEFSTGVTDRTSLTIPIKGPTFLG
jgi:parallel beta-helix repeat protein